MTNSYRWRFFRAGGFDQVKLDRGADLVHLNELDQKLWVALACPTRGIEFDTKTLDLVDTDKDGRIRAPEIIAAAKWATGCLKNPDDLLKSSPALPLSAINDATPEGKALLSSARQILSDLGKKDATEISVEDTAEAIAIFFLTDFNGDGIIPVDDAPDDATKAVMTDIINCLGAETDRSGKPGVSQAKLDQFFADATAYSDWWNKAESGMNALPLGDAAPAAATTLKAASEAWAASKAGASVEKLAIKRVREILSGKAKGTIAALIAKDKALEPEFNSISAVDRLSRYYRDLYKLLINFVSFRDFYGRQAKAVFQAGTLYLDQRSCELCIRVEDIAKHSLMAILSGSYLAYCQCTRKSTGETMTIAAAFTNGDSDNLMVGRNGIFYDRAGCDWDATIVKLIDNPISLRQAFWSPYKKVIRMIEEQVAKRAAVADAATNTQLAQTAEQTANADKATTAAAAQQPKKFDVGTVAALGVAFGSLATAFGIIFAKLADIAPWKMLFVVLGAILVISLPAVMIAALKLRKRNLGPILDANGWAVNAKAKINIPFGASLTEVAALPPGSQRDLTDPFAESHSGRNKLIVLLVVLGVLWSMWYFGCVLNYLPQGVRDGLPKSGYVLRKEKGEADEKAKSAAVATPAPAPAPAPNPLPPAAVPPPAPAPAPATP